MFGKRHLQFDGHRIGGQAATLGVPLLEVSNDFRLRNSSPALAAPVRQREFQATALVTLRFREVIENGLDVNQAPVVVRQAPMPFNNKPSTGPAPFCAQRFSPKASFLSPLV